MADTQDTKRPLVVAIAAGGTAGHINPALALAESLRDEGHRVIFFGQKSRLEGKLVPEAGFEFFPIEVRGFDRSKPWTVVQAMNKINAAKRQIRRYFKDEIRPDVAVGFGAYVELPLLKACKSEKIPYVIHEQNSVPGLANKLMAQNCYKLCLSFEQARKYFKVEDNQVALTGNPVRSQILNADRNKARKSFSLGEDDFLIVAFGGSLGAARINECMVEIAPELMAHKNIHVIHACGQKDFKRMHERLALDEPYKDRYDLREYIDNMGDILAAADLVVSRSGASSVAEIAALAKPAILIPYPHATADHQTTNAHLLSDSGAAIIIPDDQLDSHTLFEQIDSLYEDQKKLVGMKQAASELECSQATNQLKSIVLQAAETAQTK